MPTYEYICDACSHAFEQFQSITAAPIKQCPACGKKKAQRKISVGAGFIFKGGGFYETDYRSEAYKKSAEADKVPTTADAKPGDSTSGAAKPDQAKADAKPAETKSADAAPAAKAEPKPTAASKSEPKPVSKSKKR